MVIEKGQYTARAVPISCSGSRGAQLRQTGAPPTLCTGEADVTAGLARTPCQRGCWSSHRAVRRGAGWRQPAHGGGVNLLGTARLANQRPPADQWQTLSCLRGAQGKRCARGRPDRWLPTRRGVGTRALNTFLSPGASSRLRTPKRVGGSGRARAAAWQRRRRHSVPSHR